MIRDFDYAEVSAILMVVGSYRLVNRSAGPVTVSKAFVKSGV
jgi:hypothetical protein